MDALDNYLGVKVYLAARLLAAVALILFIGGIAFGIYIVAARPNAKSLLMVKAPGKYEVNLPEAGQYILYKSFMLNGLPEGFTCSINPKQSDRELFVKKAASGLDAFWQEPDRYTKVGEFTIEQPGIFEITTFYDKSNLSRDIYIGRMYKPNIIALGALFLGAVAAFVSGKLVFASALSARTNAIASLGNNLIYKEPGLQMYDQVILLTKKFSAIEITKRRITEIKKVTKVTKTKGGVPGRVDQGIEIVYGKGKRVRSTIFWSESRDKLFAKLESAGYRTVWAPT